MTTLKHPLPAETLKNARNLRVYQTNAEKILWSHLRNRQFLNLKFRRQHPIAPYIADFFCEDCDLIIELDGGQHTPEADIKRTKFLTDKGYQIIRFWNHDVLNNIEGVLQTISLAVASPLTQPSPEGEGYD